MKKVFLDSSVLFAAVKSPAGGSAKLFTLKNIKLTVSDVVLTEVERNVRKKLLDYHLERFFSLVEKLDKLDLPIKSNIVKQAEKVIVKKDAQILAQAKISRSDFLVSLDKKHFLKDKVRKFMKPAVIMTPKEFITTSKS